MDSRACVLASGDYAPVLPGLLQENRRENRQKPQKSLKNRSIQRLLI